MSRVRHPPWQSVGEIAVPRNGTARLSYCDAFMTQFRTVNKHRNVAGKENFAEGGIIKRFLSSFIAFANEMGRFVITDRCIPKCHPPILSQPFLRSLAGAMRRPNKAR